jgi:aspartate/methionine/tyrosine aminotransferase
MSFSAFRDMNARAAAIPGAIRLELGDPDFVTPSHIVDAAREAALAGFTKYTLPAGLPSLRELIAAKLRERNGLERSAAEIVVTAGACGALFTTMLALLEPGDEVLLPDPGWPNYPPIVEAVRARVAYYPLELRAGGLPDLGALEARITPSARAIVVNSPGNPSGSVFDRQTLDALLAIADRHTLWVISDEAYEDVVFEGEHVGAAGNRVVSIFSFSKSYAMTGWRVGYAVAPDADTAARIARAQEPVLWSVSSVSQKAAEAALAGPQDCVREMREAYRARRNAALARLDAAAVGYVRPSGAFYLMVDVSGAGDDVDFARRLLEEEHVAVVPGQAFGPTGAGFARISLSVAPDALAEGIERLVRLLARC